MVKKGGSPEPNKNEAPPKDIVPLFMATKSQEIFQCVCDDHVTEESPFKLIKKEDIVNDMRMRAAISDFHPVKQIVLDYPAEELLVSYDPDFKFGQNFFLCITEEAKNRFINPEPERVDSAAAAAVKDQEKADEAEAEIPVYAPPVPKDWLDQGSAAEVSYEVVVDTRPKIRYRASRIRKEFGAPFKFKDRNADHNSAAEQGLSASYLSCKSYVDPNFNIKKIEQDLAIQAVPEKIDGSSQTEWKQPINASVQYDARSVSVEESKKYLETEEFANFVKDSAPRFELAMQQNVIIDVFFDDWSVLGEEDTNFGSQSDSHMKEYQSFTDLEYSKDKTISFVDWHPQIKGVMGVACCERFTFDERIDNASKLLMNPSLVLIWSFTDPIHPQLLLEGPDDITCFKFCPSNPNIVAGGCINGQLVLWDIEEHADKINNSRGSGMNTNQKQTAMFGEEAQPDIPTIRYSAVSSIENSHRNLITSVDWVPSHFEFNRLGIPVENRNNECFQIITCGVDGNVMVWDIRVPKVTAPPTTKEQKNAQALIGTTNPFKHLDLSWKPHLKLSMPKTDSSGDYSPLKFSIPERQGVRDHVPMPSAPKPEPTAGGMAKIPSAKNQKVIESISTKYFIGTEDGEVVHCDFKLEKDNETGKLNVYKPTWSSAPHDGPVRVLQRSPFFPDLLLSVGGWNVTLWRESILSSTILRSASESTIYTAGHWSLTRPAVFFLGTKTGNIQIWDLLDRTHEPILTQNVTAAQITHIVPCIVSRKQHLLGVSDNVGTLHILEIPWNLRHPAVNEEQAVLSYLDRETKRIEYFLQRVPSSAPKKTSDSSKKSDLTKIEIDESHMDECRDLYGDYLKLEKKLLQEMGLIAEDPAEV